MHVRKPAAAMPKASIIERIRSAHLTGALQEDLQIVEAINEAIMFIDQFQWKKLSAIEAYYQDALIEAKNSDDLKVQAKVVKYLSYINDIKKREDFSRTLTNKEKQDQLHSALERHWQAKGATAETIQYKKDALNSLLTDFSQYGKFAHFTAEELATVARLIDGLINSIQYHLDSLTSIYDPVLEKLNELLACRQQIKLCMNKHLEIYQKNCLARSMSDIENAGVEVSKLTQSLRNNPLFQSMVFIPQEEKRESSFAQDSLLNNSVLKGMYNVSKEEILQENNDIFLDFRVGINELFEKNVLNGDFDVWVDMSLHHGFSTRFEFENEKAPLGTVQHYFENYLVVAPQAVFYPVDQLLKSLKSSAKWAFDTVRNVSSAVVNQINNVVNAGAEMTLATAAMAADALCYYNPAEFYIQYYKEEMKNKEVVPPQDQDEEKIASLQPAPLPEPAPLIGIPKPPVEEVVLKWQEHFTLLMNELNKEINSLRKPIFFERTSSIKLKEKKLGAMLILLSEEMYSLTDLQECVKNIIEKDKGVMSGWTSRTKKLLNHVLNGDNPDDVSIVNGPDIFCPEVQVRMMR